MKKNHKETSTQQQIFESPHAQAMANMFEEWANEDFLVDDLKRPNPPTPEAVKKAQFVDKTYVWSGK